MLTATRTTQFKRGFKLISKRGYDTELLFDVVGFILRGERLPERFRTHRLSGAYKDCWECHIKPDWLLIYRLEGETLQLVRTGTHSDCSNKIHDRNSAAIGTEHIPGAVTADSTPDKPR